MYVYIPALQWQNPTGQQTLCLYSVKYRGKILITNEMYVYKTVLKVNSLLLQMEKVNKEKIPISNVLLNEHKSYYTLKIKYD